MHQHTFKSTAWIELHTGAVCCWRKPTKSRIRAREANSSPSSASARREGVACERSTFYKESLKECVGPDDYFFFVAQSLSHRWMAFLPFEFFGWTSFWLWNTSKGKTPQWSRNRRQRNPCHWDADTLVGRCDFFFTSESTVMIHCLSGPLTLPSALTDTSAMLYLMIMIFLYVRRW